MQPGLVSLLYILGVCLFNTPARFCLCNPTAEALLFNGDAGAGYFKLLRVNPASVQAESSLASFVSRSFANSGDFGDQIQSQFIPFAEREGGRHYYAMK